MRARLQAPELRVPSRPALAFRALNFRMAKRITYTRADLKQFWEKTRNRKAFLLRPHKIVMNFIKDVRLFVMFVRDLAKA